MKLRVQTIQEPNRALRVHQRNQSEREPPGFGVALGKVRETGSQQMWTVRSKILLPIRKQQVSDRLGFRGSPEPGGLRRRKSRRSKDQGLPSGPVPGSQPLPSLRGSDAEVSAHTVERGRPAPPESHQVRRSREGIGRMGLWQHHAGQGVENDGRQVEAER